ncbi:MAG: phospho-2-dehydro-3-deoxyheptonate aldolase, partial [Deltaproteobacteria bacterium]|nr:phospho-2-dehydro-3-deoxyheptonate aldolase [Deltaproteobacteria bacterium]
MILVLQEGITPEEKDRIRTTLRGEGYIVREMVDSGRSLIGAIGEVTQNLDFFEGLPGVERVIPISTAFKLASRKIHPQDTLVQVGDAAIGGERIVVIAGPCAVESREQALATAREVKKYGAVLFRGGAFKPRTSPYSFQGLGEEGLKILAEIR